MNESITFPFPEIPGPGAVRSVAPGIWWVRMPLPFKLNHINLWLLEDDEGWLIVDTGIASKVTRNLWEKVFESSLHGKPVTGLLITHFHPDHFGLAGWLSAKWNVEIQMSATEWSVGQALTRGVSTESLERARTYDKRCGFEEQINASIHDPDNFYGISSLPTTYRCIREGDRIQIGSREWEVIIGKGHAPEHVCLWSAKDNLLIAGDQVLARISPNVSVWPESPEANPLGLFFESLEKLRKLSPVTFVLPSHGLPFHGLHSRIDELEKHHQDRLDSAVRACDEPRTVKDLVPALFGTKLAPDQMPFAVGETLAHLNYLFAAGKLARETRDGVWYFSS